MCKNRKIEEVRGGVNYKRREGGKWEKGENL